MEQNKKLSLNEEVKKEAQGVAQDVAANPELKKVTVSETADKVLQVKIEAYDKSRVETAGPDEATANGGKNGESEFAGELMPNFTGCTNDALENILSEEDKKALLLGREVMKREKEEEERLHKPNKEYHKHLNEPENRNRIFRMPRKRKFVLALVAVMVLVVGTGVTSVGSKSYLKEFWEKVHGGQVMQVANVSDMDSKEIEDGEEVTAFKEIREELHVLAVRLGFKPKGMRLKNYEVNKEQAQAILLYNYGDEVIRYFIYLNAEDSSLTQRETDDQIDEFTVKSSQQIITVKEYEVENSEKNRFIVEFEYKGVNYELKGTMKKAEIEEIIKNLNYIKENP